MHKYQLTPAQSKVPATVFSKVFFDAFMEENESGFQNGIPIWQETYTMGGEL